MKETTGNYLKLNWMHETFSDVHSILQVMFVSSLETLKDRVSNRKQMFNTDPEHISSIYDPSYFSNFDAALKSFIFDDIFIVSNDEAVAKTLLTLTKSKLKRGYRMTMNPPRKLNHSEYNFIRGILLNVGISRANIPEIISDKSLSGYFCCEQFKWTFFV
jgi:hypothetical protein